MSESDKEDYNLTAKQLHRIADERDDLLTENRALKNECTGYLERILDYKEENKALRGAKLTCADCGRTFDYINKVEQSRDELLKHLKSWRDGFKAIGGSAANVSEVNKVIRRAEKQKEKEINE